MVFIALLFTAVIKKFHNEAGIELHHTNCYNDIDNQLERGLLYQIASGSRKILNLLKNRGTSNDCDPY